MQDDRVFVWEEDSLVVAVLATSAEHAESWINQLYVLPGWNGQAPKPTSERGVWPHSAWTAYHL